MAHQLFSVKTLNRIKDKLQAIKKSCTKGKLSISILDAQGSLQSQEYIVSYFLIDITGYIVIICQGMKAINIEQNNE